jgi:MFS family permease
VLALCLAWRYLPRDRREGRVRQGRFDITGTALLALGLGAYALAMTLGRGSFGLLNVAFLLAALAAVGVFILAESHATAPLIRIGLFRDRRLSGGFFMSASVTTVVMAALVVGPFYLSGALGLDPAAVGLVMSAGPIMSALTGVPAGRLVDRFGAGLVTVGGLVAMTVGSSVMAATAARLGPAGYVGALVVITAGYATFQAANNTMVMKDVAAAQRGVVSSILNLSRNLGFITGASLMGGIFAMASGARAAALAEPEALAFGLRVTFLTAAGLTFAALVIALWIQTATRQAAAGPRG